MSILSKDCLQVYSTLYYSIFILKHSYLSAFLNSQKLFYNQTYPEHSYQKVPLRNLTEIKAKYGKDPLRLLLIVFLQMYSTFWSYQCITEYREHVWKDPLEGKNLQSFSTCTETFVWTSERLKSCCVAWSYTSNKENQAEAEVIFIKGLHRHAA